MNLRFQQIVWTNDSIPEWIRSLNESNEWLKHIYLHLLPVLVSYLEYHFIYVKNINSSPKK